MSIQRTHTHTLHSRRRNMHTHSVSAMKQNKKQINRFSLEITRVPRMPCVCLRVRLCKHEHRTHELIRWQSIYSVICVRLNEHRNISNMSDAYDARKLVMKTHFN